MTGLPHGGPDARLLLLGLDEAGVETEPGVAVLLQIQAERVGLINCSGFVKALLRGRREE